MGKKSIKENKNIYQLSREKLNLTRDKASEVLQYISADRIEKIENEKTTPHPDEILAMAAGYKVPNICNYYCSHECPIGQQYVPEVQIKELSQIVLETLAALNTMEKQKARLIEITVDGKITDDEITDFVKIQAELERISITAQSLQLWIETNIMNNQINEEKLKEIREKVKKELD